MIIPDNLRLPYLGLPPSPTAPVYYVNPAWTVGAYDAPPSPVDTTYLAESEYGEAEPVSPTTDVSTDTLVDTSSASFPKDPMPAAPPVFAGFDHKGYYVPAHSQLVDLNTSPPQFHTLEAVLNAQGILSQMQNQCSDSYDYDALAARLYPALVRASHPASAVGPVPAPNPAATLASSSSCSAPVLAYAPVMAFATAPTSPTIASSTPTPVSAPTLASTLTTGPTTCETALVSPQPVRAVPPTDGLPQRLAALVVAYSAARAGQAAGGLPAVNGRVAGTTNVQPTAPQRKEVALGPESAAAARRRARKAKEPPKAPFVLACYFCRRRKISCKRPDATDPDQSCNQCQRRDRPCSYPTQSFRGQKTKKRTDAAEACAHDKAKIETTT